MVLQDTKDQQVQPEKVVMLELLELQVRQGPQVLLAQQDLSDQQEPREQLDRQVKRVQRVLTVPLGTLVLQEL